LACQLCKEKLLAALDSKAGAFVKPTAEAALLKMWNLLFSVYQQHLLLNHYSLRSFLFLIFFILLRVAKKTYFHERNIMR